MRNTLRATFGATALLLAPNLFAAYDGVLQFTGLGGGNANGGGVFNVSTTPNVGTPALGNFGTFCIEKNEFIAIPSANYAYKLNTGAVAGGVAGINAVDANTGLSMDNISIGTAWLYSQFQVGNIATTSQGKSDLQAAIWYLENEIGSLVLGTADGTALYNAAKAATGTTDATVFGNSLGAYGVFALNLFNDNNNNGIYDTGDVALQDQLAVVPEPSTVVAAALLLLPFGASTIRILRKNRTA